ncbi:MAG: hypothetical protein J6D37_06985 [Clostridia bacterium]|nr:hypothetical protein [Clostridia bacterium]
MKKSMEALNRAKKMLQADKAPISEECKALALADITRTLKEYFSITSEVQFDAVKQGGGYAIRIAFEADRIKNFVLLK